MPRRAHRDQIELFPRGPRTEAQAEDEGRLLEALIKLADPERCSTWWTTDEAGYHADVPRPLAREGLYRLLYRAAVRRQEDAQRREVWTVEPVHKDRCHGCGLCYGGRATAEPDAQEAEPGATVEDLVSK